MYLDEYVTPETAKMLKEKGFTQITDCWYDEEDNIHVRGNYSCSGDKVFYADTCCNAPTQTVACQWLRLVYKLHIYAFHSKIENGPEWCFEIDKMDEGWTYSRHFGMTYEESIEEAIKYALENFLDKK